MELLQQHNGQSQESNERADFVRWTIGQLAILAVAMRETVTEECFRIVAEDLCSDLSQEQLQTAFTRARRELKFFPKIAELRDLAGANQKREAEAEALAAWGQVLTFVDKYVASDVYGGYEITQGCRSTPPPELSPKIQSAVRMAGGWRALKTMTAEDSPFVQKRFLESYGLAEYLDAVPLSRLLTMPEVKRLAGKKIPRLPAPATPDIETQVRQIVCKPVPAPLSDAELADRREMLRQQAATLRKQREARA